MENILPIIELVAFLIFSILTLGVIIGTIRRAIAEWRYDGVMAVSYILLVILTAYLYWYIVQITHTDELFFSYLVELIGRTL